MSLSDSESPLYPDSQKSQTFGANRVYADVGEENGEQ